MRSTVLLIDTYIDVLTGLNGWLKSSSLFLQENTSITLSTPPFLPVNQKSSQLYVLLYLEISTMYQIDQSGKIEDTAKPTVIAYSNDSQRSILIPAKVKRRVQEEFRIEGMSKLFIYQTFSVGIYYLVRDLKNPVLITIDIEYPEKDKIIYTMLKSLLEFYNKPSHEIGFARIGSRPKAHYAAKDVFDGKKKADKILSVNEIIGVTKKTDGRLRGCLSTLVDAQPRSVRHILPPKGRKSRLHI